MIIKSKSVRSKKGIGNVIKFILDFEKGAQEFFITKYVRNKNDIEQVINEFKRGEERRLFKRKNNTTLLHEVISFNGDISDEQLKKIVRLYLNERASQSRAVVCKHSDTDQIHLHLAIQGVNLEGRSSRISKERFQEVKLILENYQEQELKLQHSQVNHKGSKKNLSRDFKMPKSELINAVKEHKKTS